MALPSGSWYWMTCIAVFPPVPARRLAGRLDHSTDDVLAAQPAIGESLDALERGLHRQLRIRRAVGGNRRQVAAERLHALDEREIELVELVELLLANLDDVEET